MIDLPAQIEAILFWKAEPVTIPDLVKFLGESGEGIKTALETLTARLTRRGLALIWNNDEVMLGTAPEAGALIERLTKEDLSREIGKAGLETLSVILYRGVVTRAEIDYIRGVNSSFILRNLLVRGLVNKTTNPADTRSFVYSPTFELLSWLGVKSLSDLPEHERVTEELKLNQTTQSVSI